MLENYRRRDIPSVLERTGNLFCGWSAHVVPMWDCTETMKMNTEKPTECGMKTSKLPILPLAFNREIFFS